MPVPGFAVPGFAVPGFAVPGFARLEARALQLSNSIWWQYILHNVCVLYLRLLAGKQLKF
jgi:hypothetical protein